MGRFGVGQAYRRTEDQRFLTGTGRYTDDIQPAMLEFSGESAEATVATVEKDNT